MSENRSPFNISVLLLQEGQWWSAQCLEYDIAAQAKTLPELRNELERVLLLHIVLALEEEKKPFSELRPAPKKYWDMFGAAKLRVEADELPFRLPDSLGFPPILPRLRIAEEQSAYA
jgi:predicted RNase H-like HicB family nuclease